MHFIASFELKEDNAWGQMYSIAAERFLICRSIVGDDPVFSMYGHPGFDEIGSTYGMNSVLVFYWRGVTG